MDAAAQNQAYCTGPSPWQWSRWLGGWPVATSPHALGTAEPHACSWDQQQPELQAVSGPVPVRPCLTRPQVKHTRAFEARALGRHERAGSGRLLEARSTSSQKIGGLLAALTHLSLRGQDLVPSS